MTAVQRSVGSGDREVTFTAEAPEVAAAGATVAFMRGRLKAEGDTGAILEALRDGAVDAAFSDGAE